MKATLSLIAFALLAGCATKQPPTASYEEAGVCVLPHSAEFTLKQRNLYFRLKGCDGKAHDWRLEKGRQEFL